MCGFSIKSYRVCNKIGAVSFVRRENVLGNNTAILLLKPMIDILCTTRLLGSAAQIMSERKNVHHSILSGLESHDSVEVEAAVAAAACFTAQSK